MSLSTMPASTPENANVIDDSEPLKSTSNDEEISTAGEPFLSALDDFVSNTISSVTGSTVCCVDDF